MLNPNKISYENSSVFLTGATGFVGKFLLDYAGFLYEQGTNLKITALSRDPQKFLTNNKKYQNLPWLSWVRGNVEALDKLSGSFTHVMHCAADTHSLENRLEWYDQLIRGTRSALDFAIKVTAKKFFFMSSGAAYGTLQNAGERFKEDDSSAPLTSDVRLVYGHGKRQAEMLCALYNDAYNIDCTIGRCFAVIGEYMPLDGNYAAGNFIRDALSSSTSEIKVKGDGRAIRTYIDGRDLAEWTFYIMQNGSPGEIYNLGGTTPISISELAGVIRDIVAPDKKVTVERKMATLERSIYVPDTSKARNMGLSYRYKLSEAINKVALAHKGSIKA